MKDKGSLVSVNFYFLLSDYLLFDRLLFLLLIFFVVDFGLLGANQTLIKCILILEIVDAPIPKLLFALDMVLDMT